jgi:hypothetical protein
MRTAILHRFGVINKTFKITITEFMGRFTMRDTEGLLPPEKSVGFIIK